LNTLRSALCTGAFYTWAILIGLVMIPITMLPRPIFRLFVQTWSYGNQFLLRFIAGIRVEVRGRQYIPTGAAIVASKHQSEWEANVFLHLLRDPVYIIKKELFYVPFYGLFAVRMGMIFVDRRGHAKALRRMVKSAEARVARGRPIVIFPEGTRVVPGRKLGYRPGVAALYTGLNVPVVPVVHNSGLHWPKRSFRRYPGTIILEFLPPIPPGLERHEFMIRLEEVMESAAAKLMAECAERRKARLEAAA
jgi:1-acyl-sn-glycerol-3-phosphate acyltransferase